MEELIYLNHPMVLAEIPLLKLGLNYLIGMAGFGSPYVHADQHGAAFSPFDSNKKLFGNDGGVYFGLTNSNGSETIRSRNKNYVTSQFYTVGVAPSEMFKNQTEQVAGRDLSTRLNSTLQ